MNLPVPPLETLAAILVGIVLPVRVAIVGDRAAAAMRALDSAGRRAFYRANATTLWLLAAMVAAATLLSGDTTAWLGLVLPSPGSLGAVLGLLGIALIVTIVDLWWSLSSERRRAELAASSEGALAIAPRNESEFGAFVVLAISAAVAEEIVFRGFLISYVRDLLGAGPLGTVVAIVAPAVAFGLAHLYQGARGASRVALVGAFYGVLFVISGSLLPSMLAHLGHDLVGGWAAMRLLATQSREVR